MIALPLAPALAIALASTSARADATPTRERASSVNYCPFGLPTIDLDPLAIVHGGISGNLERTLSGRHALVVELGRAMHRDTGFGFFAAAVGYRLHRAARQASPFVGVMIGAAIGGGEHSVGELGQTVFDVRVRSVSATVHVGHRIAFGRISFTGRIGLGWSAFRATTDSADPDAQQETARLEDDFPAPITIDAELSIGYAF
jgi:hypothetical protein